MNKTHKLIEDKVRSYTVELLPEMGLELFGVSFRREKNGLTLRITIDGDNVGLEECSKISSIVSKWLDENDIVEYENYSLEVSTPGLERPLRNIEDFIRFRGRYCKIVYRNANESGTKTVKGYINNIEDNVITVFSKKEKKYFQINYDNVKKANLEVEF
jgi:ribosome maturation factor RimP